MNEHVDRCDRCGEEVKDIDIGFCVSLQKMGHANCGGSWKRTEGPPDSIPNGMTWHVPPRNHGQIVEIAYASDPIGVYRRTTDQSDHSSSYSYIPWDYLYEKIEEDFTWDPWNGQPGIPDELWQESEP